MDVANHALASYLSRQPSVLHLVTHAASQELAAASNVHVHHVPRPFGAHGLGFPLLRAAARRVQRRLGSNTRAVANGGNADLGDATWVHYVHAAHPTASWAHQRHVRDERNAFGGAETIVCNSRRTAADVARTSGVDGARIKVVYYGSDRRRFGPVSPEEREAARRMLDQPVDRPLALFAGALGDRRKNFDTLFDAWQTLCAAGDWDVDLIVAGEGAEMPVWKSRAAAVLPARIRFLGRRHDIPALLAASDVLIHPSRYEPYGLIVHEAICRGIPALVSADAGVAERYPATLASLLIGDRDSATELVQRLRDWRSQPPSREILRDVSREFHARTWDDMARDLIAAVADSVR
jgi:glycosyltransferase involved in cell wall biosynthesis